MEGKANLVECESSIRLKPEKIFQAMDFRANLIDQAVLSQANQAIVLATI